MQVRLELAGPAAGDADAAGRERPDAVRDGFERMGGEEVLSLIHI